MTAGFGIQTFLSRSLCKVLLAIIAGAVWIWLVDRGAALFHVANGKQGLSLVASIAMFGWASAVLIVIAAIVGGGGYLSTKLSVFLSRPSMSPYFVGGLLGAVAAVPFFIVGRDLASGDWISRQSYAWAVHAIPASLGTIGVAFLGWLFFRFNAEMDPRPLRRRLIGLLFLLVSMGSTAVSLSLPLNAYPNFQVLLYVLAVSTFSAAAYRAAHLLTHRLSEKPAIILTAAAIFIAVVPAVSAIGMNRETRSELVSKSSTMAQAAAKTGRYLSGSLLQETLRKMLSTSMSADSGVPWKRGMMKVGDDWNILFMVVDCLRADALAPNRKKGQKHAKKGDTPFLDKLISESFSFRNVYAQGSRTIESMPYMFRSLQPFDDPEKEGDALGTYMRSLGKTTVAVVGDNFSRAWRKPIVGLLDGFEQVSIFEVNDMDTQVDLALDVLKDKDLYPFFAWLHFLPVHAPYFDGRMLSGKDGPVPSRYRRSLKWVDGQVGKLLLGLEKLGVLNKTIIILGADHGENLGNNPSQSNGFTVFEEAIRVPLAIKIPGLKGRVIDQTAGNIDIVPTIADLLGAPLNPNHRGRSLVPLMKNPNLEFINNYYTRNVGGRNFSLVRKRDKLIYDPNADTIHRFDLATDPAEEFNLYTPSGKLDQELLFSALAIMPNEFSEELKNNNETRRLLEEAILSNSPRRPRNELGFLVSLAAQSRNKKIESHLLKIFKETKDDNVRLLLVKGMFNSNPKQWTSALVKYLKKIGGKQQELDFISRLAAQGQSPFAHRFVAERLRWWMGKNKPEAVDPWLRLIRTWSRKNEAVYGELFTSLLEKIHRSNDDESFSSERLVSVFEIVYSMNWETESKLSPRIREVAHALFEHPDTAVKLAVYKVLGKIGDGESLARLTTKFESVDQFIRLRQSALHGIVELTGKDAVPLILEYCEEPKLQSDAIVLLKELGDQRGIPLLQKIAKNHPKGTFREAAAKAVDHIRKQGQGALEL